VISLEDIRQKFTDIRAQVEKRVLDSYLLKYIETPIIDEDKLLILISIMDRLELSFKEIQNFTLSAMLIQIALDTHEHISHSSKEEKSRQLTVLAGDYFSGLYYKFLAESEDIAMIKALSHGIKEVNEHKVAIYQGENRDVDKILRDITIIESSLILKVSEYLKADSWNELISNFLLFKRLLTEKNNILQGRHSLLFEALKESIFQNCKSNLEAYSDKKDDLLGAFDQFIGCTKQVIEKGLQQLPLLNEFLRDRIITLLNQHQPAVKTFVEEG
jgi:heptaprenyl diphosphate synthase